MEIVFLGVACKLRKKENERKKTKNKNW